MSRPTPCATALVPAEAAPVEPSAVTTRRATPLHVVPAAHAPRPARSAPPVPASRARRSAWTLLLVPPARAPGVVRALSLRRWQGRLALLFLAAAVLGAAWAGGYATARMHEDALRGLHGELATADAQRVLADRRVRSLRDSVQALEQALVARDAVAAPRAGTGGATARRPARPRAAPSPLRAAEGVVLPVDGRISSGFALSRRHPILRVRRPHRGVDLAATSGTPIRAPADGRVTRVAREIGYGLVVYVRHAGGVETRYAHCRSASVAEGDVVTAGTTIATVGNSGLATAPHLHYEVRVHGTAVDPLRHRFIAGAPDG